MSNSNNNTCSSAGFDLIGLSSSLAILISQSVQLEDLDILAAFLTSLADNITLIATSRATCESEQTSNEPKKSANEFINDFNSLF